jgi:hypothetical protein
MQHFLRSFLRIGASAAVAALAFTVSRAARADTAIAADLNWVAPIDSSLKSGGGFGVRVGYYTHLPLITLVPELGFTYASFGGDYPGTVYRGIAGMRLGIGEVLRPGVFAHIGVAQLTADGPPPDPSHTALSFDAGAFLDFTLLPIINVGAHAAYNRLNASDEGYALDWMTLGLHGEIVF